MGIMVKIFFVVPIVLFALYLIVFLTDFALTSICRLDAPRMWKILEMFLNSKTILRKWSEKLFGVKILEESDLSILVDAVCKKISEHPEDFRTCGCDWVSTIDFSYVNRKGILVSDCGFLMVPDIHCSYPQRLKLRRACSEFIRNQKKIKERQALERLSNELSF